MANRYPQSLGPGVWEGSIGNVQIRWRDAAKARLPSEASVQGADLETMEALTEHFLYELAVRRGHTAVAVRAVPHEYTINSSHPERGQQPDPNHVSGVLSGGPDGQRDAHVYLGDLGTGSKKYDNVTVIGESLTKKTRGGRERDPTSWGVSTWDDSRAGSPASTSATTSTCTQVTTSSSSTPVATSSSAPSNWVWDSTYGRYRSLNPNTDQWDWH